MIIAEACQNHNGDMHLLHDMVFKAAEAGAAFIKIQTFFADDLSPEWQTDHKRIKGNEISWKDHENFAMWCAEAGIAPMTTIYDFKYAKQLQDLGFKYIKIGSPQSTNSDLLKKLIITGFKVIVSTGGRKLKDAVPVFPVHAVLHCVSAYPHSPFQSDLARMLEIKKYYPSAHIGFSDHSDPVVHMWDMPSKLAMYLGAHYIERHFTLLPRNETKDGCVSITFDQLKELVRFEKLSKEQQFEERPMFGLFSCPKEQSEYDLIKRFEERWRK